MGRWLVEQQNWPEAPPSECFVFSGTVLSSVGAILQTCTSPGDKEGLHDMFFHGS